jgi:hypothetical protein
MRIADDEAIGCDVFCLELGQDGDLVGVTFKGCCVQSWGEHQDFIKHPY